MTTLAVSDQQTFVDADEAAESVAPIVAAIDGSATSGTAVAEAVRLGLELDAPIVFVYVRRGPARFFGAPVYQRRLTRAMARAHRVLDAALAVAAGAGVDAEAEVLEGPPGRRIPEFARNREARLVVVGSRKRKLGRSVSIAVVRGAGRPVVVARDLQRLTYASGAWAESACTPPTSARRLSCSSRQAGQPSRWAHSPGIARSASAPASSSST